MPNRKTDLFSLAFQHAPDATLVLAKRVILAANLMCKPVFGWAPEELIGQSMAQLYPAKTDFDLIGERAFASLSSQSFYHDQRFMRCKDGQLRWMEARGQTLSTTAPYDLIIWSYRPIDNDPPIIGNLTPSERTVARYLANGFTTKETAKALDRSPRTIEVHRANMMRKLNARNSSELIGKLLISF